MRLLDHSGRVSCAWCVAFCLASLASAQTASNLVANGDFAADANGDGIPDFWQAAGDRATVQQLGRDAGLTGRHSARLVCTQFTADSPGAHAMICQVGHVAVQAGEWYRLRFHAKGEGIRKGSVYVALTNTRLWKNAGLDSGFHAPPEWQRQEFVFQATETLPAAASRLQFWFKSTGTLWLDEVELEAVAGGREWFPQWPAEGLGNYLPNAHFECGTANWGGYNSERGGWGNHLHQLVGEWLPDGGPDASGCLRITLDPATAPVFQFDYFDPVRRPVSRALAAHLGWIRVTPGEPMIFSAFLRSTNRTPAELCVIQADGPAHRSYVYPHAQWARYHLLVRPERPFLFVAVGPTQESGGTNRLDLWVDHLVLERGERPGEIRPRQTVESFLQSPATGNIFTNLAAGLALSVRAATKDHPATALEGTLRVTDFFDQVVYEQTHTVALTNEVSGKVRRGTLHVSGLLAGRPGFYRAAWMTRHGTNSLRCALIEPVTGTATAIGMNHAYPWDFLVELAHAAGVRWWRDWSAKWHDVERTQGAFDFTLPDEHLGRVLRLGGQPLALLPFPSAWWSASAAKTNPSGQGNATDYEARRRLVAQAPRHVDDFGRYAAAVASHYRDRIQVYHILNEPLYTAYSLPRADGYQMADYLKLLEAGYRGIKAAAPQARVVGGIGTGPDAGLTMDFITQGGLRFADILDLHLYEPPVPADEYVQTFAALETLVRQHGGPKPIWITEYGCYADDDPACLPPRTGDAAMTRSRWPSERAAAEHLVKFTAVTFAHGVRKLLLHAGTAGQINGPDEGGVFFEYGGQPRKMYPAVAVLNRLLGEPDECLGRVERGGLRAFAFRRGQQSTAIVWSQKPARLDVPATAQAWDIMGQRLAGPVALAPGTPVYLTEASPAAPGIRAALRFDTAP